MLYDFLWNTMTQPAPFSLFHIIFMLITIITTIVLIHFFKNCNDKAFRTLLFICWVIILALEGGKQILNNYDPNFRIWKSYNFAAFPFQFCSLTFYTLPLLVFLKDSKFRDLLLVFSSTFIFFGGFGYFFFPTSFCEYTFINIQTMVHHGIQVITGIFIFVHEYKKMSYKAVLKSTIFLVCAILISVLLNFIFYNIAAYPESVNMFELSPFNKTTAPVFSDILNATNYPTFVLVYIIGFLGFATITFYSMKAIRSLIRYFIKSNNVENDFAHQYH